MKKEEIIFWLREQWGDFLITLKYLLKEPYYEIKRLIGGYYNSTIVFWFTAFLFLFAWKKTGKPIRVMGILVILTYIYMFHRSGKAKQYYKTEMIEGKEVQ